MNGYQDIKDVGWTNTLPDHWEMRRAKRIFEKKERPPKESDGVITAFRDGEVTLRENRRIEGFTESLSKKNYQRIHEGDLVIHSMDAFSGAIGVSDSTGQASPVYVVCRASDAEEVNLHYYKYLLRHMANSGYIESLSKGIRERSSDFRYSEFANQFLPVPPVEEQRSIVRHLEEKTQQIENFIAKKQTLIERLETHRRAVVNRAVTRGLDEDVETRSTDFEWLDEIPAHWDLVQLRHIWDIIDCKHRTATYVDEGIPVVNPAEVKPSGLDLEGAKRTTEEEFEDLVSGGRRPKRGDIIYSRNASVGAAAYVDTDGRFCMGQDVCIIRSNDQSQKFLAYQLNSSVVLNQLEVEMVGATFKRINVSAIGRLRILLPPREEQEQITSYVREKAAEIDAAISKAERQIELMEQYRRSLIAEVVTGQVDVRTAVEA